MNQIRKEIEQCIVSELKTNNLYYFNSVDLEILAEKIYRSIKTKVLNTKELDVYVSKKIKDLIETANWIYHKGEPSREIQNRITSLTRELTNSVYAKDLIEISPKDIVKVDYGNHLKGEARGVNTWAIVLKVKNIRAYVVPIYKSQLHLDGYSPIYIDKEKDIIGVESLENGGTVVCDFTKSINRYRISEKVGKVSDELYQKVTQEIKAIMEF